MLLNDKQQVFVGKRIDSTTEAWQMPQGGIDEGEDPKTTAMREMLEEIGTDKAEIIAESKDWFYYDLPDNLVPVIWGGKFRGQKQKWHLMRFTGNDSDINLQTTHPEFNQWQWVDMNDLPDLIVTFKRELYINIIKEFALYLQQSS